MFFFSLFLGETRANKDKKSVKQWVWCCTLKRLTVSAEALACLLPLIWQIGSVTPSTCSLSAVWCSIILINVPLMPQNRLMNQRVYGTTQALLLTVSVAAVYELVMIHWRAKREVWQVISDTINPKSFRADTGNEELENNQGGLCTYCMWNSDFSSNTARNCVPKLQRVEIQLFLIKSKVKRSVHAVLNF